LHAGILMNGQIDVNSNRGQEPVLVWTCPCAFVYIAPEGAPR